VSPQSNSPFQGLPNPLQFNIIPAILLLSIPVTYHSKFDLYLLSSSSGGSAFRSYKIDSILLLSKVSLLSGSSEKFSSRLVSVDLILFATGEVLNTKY
jgi:hypothetical protein